MEWQEALLGLTQVFQRVQEQEEQHQAVRAAGVHHRRVRRAVPRLAALRQGTRCFTASLSVTNQNAFLLQCLCQQPGLAVP